jgi:hypothetical protein
MSAATINARGQNICTGSFVPEAFELALIYRSVWQRLHFGSGDGERKTLLTRQIAFEPLPASVLSGLVLGIIVVMGSSDSSP